MRDSKGMKKAKSRKGRVLAAVAKAKGRDKGCRVSVTRDGKTYTGTVKGRAIFDKVVIEWDHVGVTTTEHESDITIIRG